jgi:hypothetical protein
MMENVDAGPAIPSPRRNRRGMLTTTHGRRVLSVVLAVGAVGGAGFGAAVLFSDSSAADAVPTISLQAPAGTHVVRVGAARHVAAVSPGFLGFSFEYTAVRRYAGLNGLDPVFLQLIRNLNPGQSPVLRIGGDTTDWSWVPKAGVKKPAGASFALSRPWLQAVSALVHALHAHAILGINLEADNASVAAAEGRAFVRTIGASSIKALEIGNEPELYSSVRWYATPSGASVFGRPPSYSIANYASEFARYARRLPKVRLAGPAIASGTWWSGLPGLFHAERRLGMVTVHAYPLSHCYSPRSSKYPTLAHLMARSSSMGLAQGIASTASAAHARGLKLRVDELNSASCRGQPGLSNTFASGLWALDTLFALASVGVDGVNVHTLPASVYQPFTRTRVGDTWRWSVDPLYYGLLMFTEAAPVGSRLLSISGSVAPQVRTWATRTPTGQTRVVLINEYRKRHEFVRVAIPGATQPAVLTALRAPSITATHDITLGGQSFGSQTDSGLLGGQPKLVDVAAVRGAYVLRLPPGSAAMLTIPARTTSR